MQLAALVARIESKMPVLKDVTVAPNAQTAVEALIVYPSACIILPRGNAGANSLTGAVQQNVDDTFGVLLAVHNVTDMHGQAAAAEMDVLRPLLVSALLGWTFDPAYAPIEYAGYQLLAYKDGLLLMSEHFKTQHQVRAVGAQ